MTLARSTDPSTSHAAAESVTELTVKQAAVLRCLGLYENGLTDQSLVMLYQHHARSSDLYPYQSESGIRTRRSELVAQGLVRDSGRRRTTDSGRQAIVWVSSARQSGIFAVAA